MAGQPSHDRASALGREEQDLVQQPMRRRTDARVVGVARRTVASYRDYQDAERAVGRLAREDFPADQTMIVGCGLRFVERVTGRATALSVALRAAVAGAVVGAFTGWLLGIFNLVDPLVAAAWLAVNGALLGMVLGAVIGLISYVVTRGRRDFTAVAAIRAERYDVLTDAEIADRAVRLLQPAPPETSPAG